MFLSKITHKCDSCNFNHICPNKKMEGVGFLTPSSNVFANDSSAKISKNERYYEIHLDSKTTVSISADEIKKQLSKDLYKDLYAQFGT